MATLTCCRYVHGDIKPENFLMGHPDSPNAKELYLVDLGLSQRYTAPNGNHYPYRQIPTDFRWAPFQRCCFKHLTRRCAEAASLPSVASTPCKLGMTVSPPG